MKPSQWDRRARRTAFMFEREAELQRLLVENATLRAALTKIAEADYRGPRPSESVIAQAALDATYSDEGQS